MNNEQVRAAALEEAVQAAQECDVATMKWAGQTLDDGVQTKSDIVAAIRALASTAAPERSGKLADDEAEFQQRFRECMRDTMALRAPADSSSAAPSDAIALFESILSNDPSAYTRPGETVYQITANEVIEFAKKLAAPSPTVGSAAPSDLEIRVRKVLEGVHIETGRTDEFECVVANMVAAIGATAPTREGAWKTLADKAIAVLCRHIVPDGISDKEALSELYGIFDGPEYRAALDAPSPTGESLSDEQIESEARKYGVFVSGAGSYLEGNYDITKYECREDFFNCVRACAALATPRQTEDGSGLIYRLDRVLCNADAARSDREIIDACKSLLASTFASKETAPAALGPDLISDLNDAISAARWQASHAGSATRIKRWDDVRDRLAAILAAAPTPPAPL